MGFRHSLIALFALLALAAPAGASAAPSSGAVVFSRVTQSTETKKVEGETPKPGEAPKTETKTIVEGGLFAVKDGRLNQLTEDPTDTEPAFSPDGTAIVFVRGGHLFSVRADGSGLRQLSSGTALDSKPLLSPDGRLVVFERRAALGAPADLYTVRARGGGLHPLTTSAADDHDADFSADGRTVAFVRSAGGNDDIFSVRPCGARQVRLTRTGGLDEFEPRFFAGGILFSRGDSSDTPAAYADVYTMRANGKKVKRRSAAPARPTSKTSPRRAHAALPPRPGPLGEADRADRGPQALPAARRLGDQRPPPMVARRRLRRRRGTRAAGRDRRRQRPPAGPRRGCRPRVDWVVESERARYPLYSL